MIKVVLATCHKMNGDNENWTVACGFTFKLIFSSCQFRMWPRLRISRGGTDHRMPEERINGWRGLQLEGGHVGTAGVRGG